MNSFGLVAARHSRVVRGLCVLLLVMLAGTAGYMIIEDWSLLESAYMASITITTVGYSEVRPLSQTGQVFTIGLMFLGVGAAFYILTALVAAIIEGDLRQVFGARRMKLMIERINNHHIVCGYGRVGEQVARELQRRDSPFVVVEANEARAEYARARGILVVHGDATVEETLLGAGIERCRAIIAASDTDATNTYITLTAKGLRKEVHVVARVSSEDVEAKLLQAGADRTVSLYRIGGRRLAFAALQPLVTDFIDIFQSSDHGDRVLAEIHVKANSGLVGRQLSQAIQGRGDLTVLAVRDTQGRLEVAPPRSRVLAEAEILIVVGEEQDLGAFGSGGSEQTSAPSSERRGSLQRFLRRH